MTDRRLDSQASLTAQINAAQRAAESMQPAERRLVTDPFARHFVSHPLLRLLLSHRLLARAGLHALDHLYGGLHAHISLRSRYTADAYQNASADGMDQVVLLGAGFDSTGLRNAPSMTTYEVDAPATQLVKRAIVDRLFASSSRQIRWIACDFEHNSLHTSLTQAGFDPARRSLIIWLGVSFYLTRDAIELTLTNLAALCAPGSKLVLDYGEPGIVDGTSRWRGARRGTRLVARFGEPYRTGFTRTQLNELLSAKGFLVRDHVGLTELVDRYAPSPWCSTDNWPGIATAERV